MFEDVTKLKKLIIEEKYKHEANTTRSFGGAGLIITHEGDDRKADVVVHTKYEKELSWLVYKLASLTGGIDYLNKYSFYPHIGELANEYILNNGDDNIKDMMIYIVEKMEGWNGNID